MMLCPTVQIKSNIHPIKWPNFAYIEHDGNNSIFSFAWLYPFVNINCKSNQNSMFENYERSNWKEWQRRRVEKKMNKRILNAYSRTIAAYWVECLSMWKTAFHVTLTHISLLCTIKTHTRSHTYSFFRFCDTHEKKIPTD